MENFTEGEQERRVMNQLQKLIAECEGKRVSVELNFERCYVYVYHYEHGLPVSAWHCLIEEDLEPLIQEVTKCAVLATDVIE